MTFTKKLLVVLAPLGLVAGIALAQVSSSTDEDKKPTSSTTQDMSTSSTDQNAAPMASPSPAASPQSNDYGSSTSSSRPDDMKTSSSSATSDTSATSSSDAKRLPKTASDLPLEALIGGLALGAGVGLRALRK